MKSIYSFTVHTTEEVQEKTKEKRKNKKTGVEEEVEVSKKIQNNNGFEKYSLLDLMLFLQVI